MAVAVSVVLASYLVSAIPVAYIAGRLKGIDIRRYGSANVGASNVYQSVAHWAVVPVGLAQIALAMAGIGLAKLLDQELSVQVAAGVAALVGACWSVYLRLGGGRGIGASIGFMLFLTPMTLAVFVVVSMVGVFARSVPLGVGLGIALAPLSSVIVDGPGSIAFGCLCMAVIIFTKRLLGNPGVRAEGLSQREVMLNRLLFDRDMRDREEWVRKGLNGRGA
ncbi:MAG TPA: glycerol-3-phosphate acyltransferase [Dehalococcoidia bacterium]|nr:glycerol-3-phosphate acyltransferase [Dehalococcoidia bacterium]